MLPVRAERGKMGEGFCSNFRLCYLIHFNTMKHQLDYLLKREETTQRQVSKELQIKMCACERGYPHTLTHVLTRCLLNFTSVCKTTTASVCTARPLCIPKMRPRPRAWLPGDRPPHPRCSLEAPIAVAERVQAQTERCLIKEG